MNNVKTKQKTELVSFQKKINNQSRSRPFLKHAVQHVVIINSLTRVGKRLQSQSKEIKRQRGKFRRNNLLQKEVTSKVAILKRRV